MHFDVRVGPLTGALHEAVAHRGALSGSRWVLAILLDEHLLGQVIRVALLHLSAGRGQLVVLSRLEAARCPGKLRWRVDLLGGHALLRRQRVAALAVIRGHAQVLITIESLHVRSLRQLGLLIIFK